MLDLYGLISDGVYLVIGGRVFSLTWLVALFLIAVLLLIASAIGRTTGKAKGFNEGVDRGFESGRLTGWQQAHQGWR